MALSNDGRAFVLLYRWLRLIESTFFPQKWDVFGSFSLARLASPYINRHLSHSPLQLSLHNIHQKYQQPPCPLLTSSFIIDLPSSSSIGHHYHHHQQLPAIMHTSALQRARQLSITRKTTTASQHARLNTQRLAISRTLALHSQNNISPRAK